MLITHIVSFKYKSDVSDASRREIATAFEALKDECKLNDGAGERYILDIQGGVQCSPESTAGSEYDHAFVLTFRQQSDIDYYLDHDPAHLEFKRSLAGKIDKAWVFDFAK